VSQYLPCGAPAGLALVEAASQAPATTSRPTLDESSYFGGRRFPGHDHRAAAVVAGGRGCSPWRRLPATVDLTGPTVHRLAIGRRPPPAGPVVAAASFLRRAHPVAGAPGRGGAWASVLARPRPGPASPCRRWRRLPALRAFGLDRRCGGEPVRFAARVFEPSPQQPARVALAPLRWTACADPGHRPVAARPRSERIDGAESLLRLCKAPPRPGAAAVRPRRWWPAIRPLWRLGARSTRQADADAAGPDPARPPRWPRRRRAAPLPPTPSQPGPAAGLVARSGRRSTASRRRRHGRCVLRGLRPWVPLRAVTIRNAAGAGSLRLDV